MENQRPAKRRREPILLSLFPQNDAVGTCIVVPDDDDERISQFPQPKLLSLFPLKDAVDDEDRISQLPLPILQNHILSLLPQKDAVRTCVLSKSWRHLGSTLPKFEFLEFSFLESKEKFISILENTLQRYDDQKLSIQEFILEIRIHDPQSVLFLNKWIPIVTKNMGVKTFKLTTIEPDASFLLPSVVKQAIFVAETLTELHLTNCKLNQINCIVKLHVLKRLELLWVNIEDETLEKIMSSCLLIEHLVLFKCQGLSTTKLIKAHSLKRLSFTSFKSFFSDESFEINDAPNLETIGVHGCTNWFRHNNYFSPRLTSLKLWGVDLPTESLNSLSLNCPCLEVLELKYCSGLNRESKLSNRSIKYLIIVTSVHPFETVIDVPNMLSFEFQSTCLPSISFATTSREWNSLVHVGSPIALWNSGSYYHLHPDPNDEDWPLKLYEFLKALSQSRITINIYDLPLTNLDTYDGGSCDPVAVEHMCLRAHYSSFELPVLLNCLFRTFRPMYIGLSLPTDFSPPISKITKENHKIYERELAESIWTILENKGETRQCNIWQQDLEKSSIQVSYDKNPNMWYPVQAVCALKWRSFS